MKKPFKPGDRVIRVDDQDGPLGTVQNIRIETVRSSLKPDSSEPRGIAVTVLWDNGTSSHFVPEGLRKIGEVAQASK